MDNFLLEHMFDWATPYPWTWFVTLKYPKEKSPKHRNFRAVNAEDAFDCWISEMLNRDGTPKLPGVFLRYRTPRQRRHTFSRFAFQGFQRPST